MTQRSNWSRNVLCRQLPRASPHFTALASFSPFHHPSKAWVFRGGGRGKLPHLFVSNHTFSLNTTLTMDSVISSTSILGPDTLSFIMWQMATMALSNSAKAYPKSSYIIITAHALSGKSKIVALLDRAIDFALTKAGKDFYLKNKSSTRGTYSRGYPKVKWSLTEEWGHLSGGLRNSSVLNIHSLKVWVVILLV